jgi:hypothetical protein
MSIVIDFKDFDKSIFRRRLADNELQKQQFLFLISFKLCSEPETVITTLRFFRNLRMDPIGYIVTLSKEKTSQRPGNTKGGSITVPLTSCLTGLE